MRLDYLIILGISIVQFSTTKKEKKKEYKEIKRRYHTIHNTTTNRVVHSDGIVGYEKFVCPEFKCKDIILQNKTAKEIEIYSTLATRLYSRTLEPMDHILINKPVLPVLFDWLLVPYLKLKDNSVDILYGNVAIPKTIYVKTEALRVFMKKILPNLTHPFVLYTGSNDFTIPRNVDLRFNSTEYNAKYQLPWNRITHHKLLLHWYVENHDVLHPKVSTMPIGMNPKEFHPDDRTDFSPDWKLTALKDRPFKILSVDRTRPGPQWLDRKNAHENCQKVSEICQAVDSALSHSEFVELVSSFPFLLCVHGGGIGAFLAMYSIHFTINLTYHFLPCLPCLPVYRSFSKGMGSDNCWRDTDHRALHAR